MLANRGDIGLVEDQLRGLPPTLAQFAAIGRKGQHVGDGVANGTQNASVLRREELDELLGEVRGRQPHAAYLGGRSDESNRSSYKAPP